VTRLDAGDVFWPGSQRNPAVVRVVEVVGQMALAAEPKMFNLNVGPNSMRSTYYAAIAKIVKLLAALRIHTLGDHAGPLGLLR
jgi:hypothetical protein